MKKPINKIRSEPGLRWDGRVIYFHLTILYTKKYLSIRWFTLASMLYRKLMWIPVNWYFGQAENGGNGISVFTNSFNDISSFFEITSPPDPDPDPDRAENYRFLRFELCSLLSYSPCGTSGFVRVTVWQEEKRVRVYPEPEPEAHISRN